ncbi:MAG: polysaccharide deacetylase family protein [Bacteroidia bacterium]
MLLVYTPSITSRLKYIFNLVINQLAGIDFTFTASKEDFINSTNPKINYSHHSFGDELFFEASGLLEEKGIVDKSIDIEVFPWEDSIGFFKTKQPSALPFDVFSAAFYLVSRYEEYLPHIKDTHSRFTPNQSLAFNNNFLQKPVVNIWAKKIKTLIKNKFPEITSREHRYKFVSTVDIDNAFAYVEKGGLRTAGALARSLFFLNFSEFIERVKVISGIQDDPYDTYQFMLDLHKNYNIETIYFFLVGEYGENDKNVSIKSNRLQTLIKTLADYGKVGIHPSYGSSKDPVKLRRELNSLSKILKRDVTKSRQHFLRLNLPTTYRLLIDLDITEDYTMGYANDVGFRASICSPFRFYDLDMENETTLTIYPFAVMDATLLYYLKIKNTEAINYIKPLVDEVKAVNGIFISLWHNESLSDKFPWTNWKHVYEEMVEYASQ